MSEKSHGDGERRLPVSDLVGSQEIADRLGWTRAEYVHTVAGRDSSFPEPVAVLGRSRVWSWSDVREWAVRTGRLPPGGDR